MILVYFAMNDKGYELDNPITANIFISTIVSYIVPDRAYNGEPKERYKTTFY